MVDKSKKSAYNKKYYSKNRIKLLQKNKAKIKCECGAMISKGNIATHRKSKKHIIFSKLNTNHLN